MTKRLEEILNLPDSQLLIKEEKQNVFNDKIKESAKIPQDNLFRNIQDFDKISSALPQVTGLGDASDSELDSLAQRATDAYDDLMDLGMNVEPRYSGRIFEVASSMLKNAIDAKSAKLDKKLKMIELQLRKQKLDQDVSTGTTEVEGEGYLVTDRNSLIERLRNMK